MALLSHIITTLFDDVYYIVFVSFFVWCPCVAIDVSIQYNDGLLQDIILLTQGHSLPRHYTVPIITVITVHFLSLPYE